MKTSTRILITLAMVSSLALVGLAPSAGAAAGGMTQISGMTDDQACTTPPAGFEASQTPDGYSLHIVGDLEGCIYGVITGARCHPSGMYQEVADEIFVSDANSADTFQMTEFFWAKFTFAGEACESDVTGQLLGGCKHPIVDGSGTGAFEGVRGRLDFKDDVDIGVAFYKGHLG